ncbi:MAG: SMC-Scp complex subunit ScpB [Candidatus Thiodiazotropha sp. (ex Dulcina madagascariensis)]|nr:SMC-Scp complex subunit ScpB [Candidatus Thiodiazotropha sp. (ex Dulcina madagascariensis)]MCU7928453.1 SMC-Scp complex subunit ScpB [Candidatus Thiodiazotropha sp. (ex Dulcina madagascariensis)]
MSDQDRLKQIVEAALLAAGRPLNLDQLQALFEVREQPEKKQLREVLAALGEAYQGRGIEVTEVGSGFRIQVCAEFAPWVSKLWAERPPKYSRALLETLALIAYRQPITRGEIEEIRGVSVSTNIVKTLSEREWVRVVGHRDVPGKPALYATTKEFLDYFNLRGLNELPTLAEIRDLDSINRELELVDPDKVVEASGSAEEGESGDRTALDETDALADEFDGGLDEETVPLDDQPGQEASEVDIPPDEIVDAGITGADSETEISLRPESHESE